MDEAFRITLEYNGDEFTLKSIRKLAMRVPPSQCDDRQIGRYIELRGGKNEPLYRRQVGQLIPDTIEFPTGDPMHPFGHARMRGRRSLSLLVPAHERARSVAIVDARRRAPTKKGKSENAAAAAAGPRDLFTVKLPLERKAD